jgi:hypothetical protein
VTSRSCCFAMASTPARRALALALESSTRAPPRNSAERQQLVHSNSQIFCRGIYRAQVSYTPWRSGPPRSTCAEPAESQSGRDLGPAVKSSLGMLRLVFPLAAAGVVVAGAGILIRNRLETAATQEEVCGGPSQRHGHCGSCLENQSVTPPSRGRSSSCGHFQPENMSQTLCVLLSSIRSRTS